MRWVLERRSWQSLFSLTWLVNVGAGAHILLLYPQVLCWTGKWSSKNGVLVSKFSLITVTRRNEKWRGRYGTYNDIVKCYVCWNLFYSFFMTLIYYVGLDKTKCISCLYYIIQTCRTRSSVISTQEMELPYLGRSVFYLYLLNTFTVLMILEDGLLFLTALMFQAQNIKNFKSQRWQYLLNFNTERRLLLTGTPLQNNLMELWSLMHFLMPHLFESHKDFKDWFSNPLSGMIEGSSEYNENLIKRLHKVSTFMIFVICDFMCWNLSSYMLHCSIFVRNYMLFKV